MEGDTGDWPDEAVSLMAMPCRAAVRTLPPSNLIGDNMKDAVRAEKGTCDVGSFESFIDETIAS